MTVTDPESIGIQIDGDQAIVNNEGGEHYHQWRHRHSDQR